MKSITLFSCILVSAFIGLASAQEAAQPGTVYAVDGSDPITTSADNNSSATKDYQGPLTPSPGIPTPPKGNYNESATKEYMGPATLPPGVTLPSERPSEYMGPATLPPGVTLPSEHPSADYPTPPFVPDHPPYLINNTTSRPTSTTSRPTSTTTLPPQTTTPKEKPCGSNNLGDYKGGCDESVPVIVLPKGRPIMEKVLDWFKCNTEECRSNRK